MREVKWPVECDCTDWATPHWCCRCWSLAAYAHRCGSVGARNSVLSQRCGACGAERKDAIIHDGNSHIYQPNEDYQSRADIESLTKNALTWAQIEEKAKGEQCNPLPRLPVGAPSVDAVAKRVDEVKAVAHRTYAFLCGLSPYLDDARISPEMQREYLWVVREFGKLAHPKEAKREAELEKTKS